MVKTYHVVDMIENALTNTGNSTVVRFGTAAGDILMSEAERTTNPNELLVTFTNVNMSEDKYLIQIKSIE